MGFNRGSLTTKTYTRSCVGFTQFMYGNAFTTLDAFWSSLCNLFFILLASIFRVHSDKETSLVVVKTHNKRCDYLSDKSITCYVEEPKAFRFVFRDYHSPAVQEEMKMVTFSDESVLVEKPFVVENNNKLVTSLSEGCFVKEHVKEDMLVYEFMRSGVLKGLLAHESFAGVEDNLFDEEGLLKLKDSSKPSRNKVKPPHKNLWPFKKHKLERDPVERQASRDFETVYVSQLCLSWEMLRWQYTKLLEFDSHVAATTTTYQYNLVAGEFQLFQVLLQRFVENEPFQNSSRVETYLKNRRHFHNFLQIPLSNKKCRNEGEFAVKIETLREIILESMRVFWEFLCADKDELSSVIKVSHQTQVSPQDPLDLELLTDMRTHLQKKEKKLKEILRSQCCIVKKLKKNESKSSSVRVKDELLIAQIELRVISRVMTMSKLTTEKLVWCQEKLNRMSFNVRKIHMEPSFSLLPC
ncbi:hypothetical protein Rs2_04272 [Raphanus sativus]|nr:hypothetical protein Rs2_04272 [Raphanus sativus]